jgi:hypothetical protein
VVTMSAPAGRCWRRLAHASESLLLSAPAASRAAAFAPAVGHRAACMQQVWGGSTGMQASMAMLPCPCDKPLQAGRQAGRQAGKAHLGVGACPLQPRRVAGGLCLPGSQSKAVRWAIQQ